MRAHKLPATCDRPPRRHVHRPWRERLPDGNPRHRRRLPAARHRPRTCDPQGPGDVDRAARPSRSRGERAARVGSGAGDCDRERDPRQAHVSEQGRARARVRLRGSGIQDEIDRPDVSRKKLTSKLGRSPPDQKVVPGIGHPVHKPADPRAVRLFALASENGFAGRHVELMGLIAEEATSAYGRDLPVNATGAIAAIATEMDFPWRITRGLAVMARAIGLVAHLQEEMDEPMASEIWSRTEGEASSDMPADRD